jgi:hypothetical protein
VKPAGKVSFFYKKGTIPVKLTHNSDAKMTKFGKPILQALLISERLRSPMSDAFHAHPSGFSNVFYNYFC